MADIWWASDWRCPDCGGTVPIEPGQDTRPIREAHECDPPMASDEQAYALDLTGATAHECVFVEEEEPLGRLILPPCITCGLTALDALEQMRQERRAAGQAWAEGARSRQCQCHAYSEGECACGNYPSEINPYRDY